MDKEGKILLDDQSSAILARLLGRIVHDFNNPLAAIIGFSDLLKNPKVVPAKRERYVNRIYEQAIKLSELVDAMASFSTRPELQVLPLDLSRTVSEVVSLREVRVQDAGLELVLEGLDRAVMVSGDRNGIGRIICALLDNAEQVFKENPVLENRRIGIFCRAAEEGGEVLVADSGSGVPIEQCNDIFEPFFSTRRSGGLGLGLTLARQFADKMGGMLELLTAAGEPFGGAVFRLHLPSPQGN